MIRLMKISSKIREVVISVISILLPMFSFMVLLDSMWEKYIGYPLFINEHIPEHSMLIGIGVFIIALIILVCNINNLLVISLSISCSCTFVVVSTLYHQNFIGTSLFTIGAAGGLSLAMQINKIIEERKNFKIGGRNNGTDCGSL